jgi:hypothetical protein
VRLFSEYKYHWLAEILCTTIWIKQNTGDIASIYRKKSGFTWTKPKQNTQSIKNDFSVTVNENKINLSAFSMRYTELRWRRAYASLSWIIGNPANLRLLPSSPYLQQKRFSSVLKPYGSAVSYYLNKGDKIYTDEIKKSRISPCFKAQQVPVLNFSENGSRASDCHSSSWKITKLS